MSRYVVITKQNSHILFAMDTSANDSWKITWTSNIYKAKIFNRSGDRNGTVVGCWSGGIPADTIEIDRGRQIVDTDKYNKWLEWVVPDPAYHDSSSGCRRLVHAGP